eukprot:gene6232-2852_t
MRQRINEARKPATTTLSPYLKFGCLSPRLFHTRLLQIYKEQKKHSEPPVGAHTPNFSHMVGNTVCRQIDWRHQDAATADSEAEQHLAAWKAGRTGFPWIDAIMTQLHEWDMPAKYIYEPWLAPTEVQKKAKCIIGVDYPRPIVDHSIASKQNIGRMAAAYKANKGEGEGEAADTPKKAAKPRKAAAPKAAKKEATDVVSGKGAKRQRTMKEFASKKETE